MIDPDQWRSPVGANGETLRSELTPSLPDPPQFGYAVLSSHPDGRIYRRLFIAEDSAWHHAIKYQRDGWTSKVLMFELIAMRWLVPLARWRDDE